MERRVICKAAFGGGRGGAHPLSDEPCGEDETLLADVIMHGAAGLLLKQAHKVITAEITHGGKLIYTQAAGEVFIYIRKSRRYLAALLGGGSLAARVALHYAV